MDRVDYNEWPEDDYDQVLDVGWTLIKRVVNNMMLQVQLYVQEVTSVRFTPHHEEDVPPAGSITYWPRAYKNYTDEILKEFKATKKNYNPEIKPDLGLPELGYTVKVDISPLKLPEIPHFRSTSGPAPSLRRDKWGR